jgi:hypothetical protein
MNPGDFHFPSLRVSPRVPPASPAAAAAAPEFLHRRARLLDLHASQVIHVFRGQTLFRRFKEELSRLFSGPRAHS